MKSKILLITLLLNFYTNLFGQEIFITAKEINFDKEKQVTIFKNKVYIKTQEGYEIQCDYAYYNKLSGILELKDNIVGKDIKKNTVRSSQAKYDENNKTLLTVGPTKITTSEGYTLEGSDIMVDNLNGIINSYKNSTIVDKDNNLISLNNFNYQVESNLLKSIGLIDIKDKLNNNYKFSQIYIDTKKKEMIGTDVKAFFNDENFKVNKKNKPRIFSNTSSISQKKSFFTKSTFTFCDYRKNDKCPPWSILSSKILHDNEKKTIYHDNAVIKFYDVPIFYLPKLSYPDPTVKRRSGFLIPSFSDTKNLGSSITIPYFSAINEDKNLTLTSRFFFSENPLFLGEYHQAYKNSSFLTDFGYSEGYKKTSAKKKPGNKSHFFSKFVKNFSGNDGSNYSINIFNEHISDDKYLKLYKIKTDLVDYNTDTLKNSIEFTREDEDSFIGFNASVYESINKTNNDKYEYIYPELTLDKNLISDDKIGNIDLQSNFKINKFDTNKYTNFLVNDLNWSGNEISFDNGIISKFVGNIKNINYEAKNVDIYKKNTTNEIFGALGFLSQLNLSKSLANNEFHYLKPKLLVRYAPGSMRKELEGSRLDPITAFNLNRLDNINNYETGITGTYGLDYKIKKNDTEVMSLSLAQIINEKENKKMSSKSSMDEKLSDLVGSTNYNLNERVKLDYNFAIDQNYNKINYNEIGTEFNFNPIKIDFNFIEESKHIGDQKYFKTNFEISKNENGLFSFSTKRNLLTDSSEYYNLSYEYINDCLRAGLVYRREFYEDSELDAENSLMFKITLSPIGDIESPSFNR